MQMTYDCIPCLLKQCNLVLRTADLADDVAEDALRELLRFFADADLSGTPPMLSRAAWGLMTRRAGTDDPFADIKTRFNRGLLAHYDLIRQRMDTPRSALKLAILGNIIDLGANQTIDQETVLAAMEDIAAQRLVIDDQQALWQDLAQARTLLYLGDNCGEIVFDKAFIAYLREAFPTLAVQYAVRGRPIINDVTRVDAQMVGMDQVATVIDNGDGAPGTLLDSVSPAFRAAFDAADVIIGKGQGNFESLNDVARPRVYLCFMAKCAVVSAIVGAPPMSLICMDPQRHQVSWR